MKVKLYGTLGQAIPGYRHSQEIDVEIPDGARVKDLLARLEISTSQGAVVIAEGRILQDDHLLEDGVSVNVLQAIRGGCHNQFYGLSAHWELPWFSGGSVGTYPLIHANTQRAGLSTIEERRVSDIYKH